MQIPQEITLTRFVLLDDDGRTLATTMSLEEALELYETKFPTARIQLVRTTYVEKTPTDWGRNQ